MAGIKEWEEFFSRCKGHPCILLRLDPAISTGMTNGRVTLCWARALWHPLVVPNSQMCVYRSFNTLMVGESQSEVLHPHRGEPMRRFDEADPVSDKDTFACLGLGFPAFS